MSELPERQIWRSMIHRCHNPISSGYPAYGARGIEVCPEWRIRDRYSTGFRTFLRDMGLRPTVYHSLDRLDNDGHYEPGNCRWALPHQQARNTRRSPRITLWGQNRPLGHWCEALGLPDYSYHYLAYAIRRGANPRLTILLECVRVRECAIPER